MKTEIDVWKDENEKVAEKEKERRVVVMDNEAHAYVVAAENCKITNAVEMTAADYMFNAAAMYIKRIKDHHETMKKEAHKTWKSICKAEADLIEPYITGRKFYDNKMVKYRYDLKEQERVDNKARAEKAEAAGVEAPVATYAPPKTKTTFHKTWIIVGDIDKTKVPIEYMEVDRTKITKAIRAMDGEITIPGVTFEQVETAHTGKS